MRIERDVLIRWLRNGLAKDGKTQLGLAQALGYANNSPISKMLKGKPIRADQLSVISSYLEEPLPPQLIVKPLFTDGIESVFLIGFVDALSWKDAGVGTAPVQTSFPKYPAPPYGAVRQEAFQIDDDLSGSFAQRGDCVLTVKYSDVDRLPHKGDIVVTIETRLIDGHPHQRTSLKRIVKSGGSLALAPMSGNGDPIPLESCEIRRVIAKVLYLVADETRDEA